MPLDILETFNVIRAEFDAQLILVQNYLKSDAPLEDRWGVYLTVESYLSDTGYIFELSPAQEDLAEMGLCDEDSELTYYDHLYMDKYASRSFSSIIETLQENFFVDSTIEPVSSYQDELSAFEKEHDVEYYFLAEGGADLQNKLLNKYCPLNRFKEAIMQSGCGSVTNDW